MNDIKTETLRAAVLGALKDLIDGEYQHARGESLEVLLDAYRDLGVKSVDVSMPGGRKVAGITLVEPSDEVVVVDRTKFTDWVIGQAPEMVAQDPSPVEVVEEAIDHYVISADARHLAALDVLAALGIDPEPPPPRVSRVYETELLSMLVHGGSDNSAVHPDTGEMVPGVEYRPGGEPTKFQMRYKPDGRALIAQAWRQNRLPNIEGLPEVGS